MFKPLLEKFKEALISVLPISILILILNFSLIHLENYYLVAFLIGFVFLVFGVTLFSLGADISMIPMGSKLGKALISKRMMWLLLLTSFLIGFLITIAEPDLMVLAAQFSDNEGIQWLLICSIGSGVGLFLMLSTWRVIYNVRLKWLLIIGYAIIFFMAFLINFKNSTFIPVAFDSGGVTTGPITVPFILAFGLGLASNTKKEGKEESDSSFGAVSICSMGPILSVLILGIFMNSDIKTSSSGEAIDSWSSLGSAFSHSLFDEMGSVLLPIILIAAIFLIFQITILKIDCKSLVRILIGLLLTYIGLVLFLTGAKIGFLNIGTIFGETIGVFSYNWILIPLGALIGFFVVLAEPSVHVLTAQVENITNGAVKRKTILFALAIGVGLAIALAMIRVLYNIPIWYILIPGYAIAIILIFFVPEFFTSIAFDSGGVASGPLTSTFILPLTMGVCASLYASDSSALIVNSFGVVSFVAMAPLITIQLLGLNYKIKMNKYERALHALALNNDQDDEIITFKKEG